MSCTRTSTAPPRLMRDSPRFQLSECPPLWCHVPRSVRTHVSTIRPYLCSYLDQLDDNTHSTAIIHLFNNSLISVHIYFMSKLTNEANSTIRKCSHDMLPEPMKATKGRGENLFWGRLCIVDGEILFQLGRLCFDTESPGRDVISAKGRLGFGGRLYIVTPARYHS